jgi:hypothetical protein
LDIIKYPLPLENVIMGIFGGICWQFAVESHHGVVATKKRRVCHEK